MDTARALRRSTAALGAALLLVASPGRSRAADPAAPEPPAPTSTATSTPTPTAAPTAAPPSTASASTAAPPPDGAQLSQGEAQAGPDGAPVPASAPPSLAAAPARAGRPAELFWYRPTDEADTVRPWNSSILGAFDPWTKDKVTVLGQWQTFRMRGGQATGKTDIKDAQGNGAKQTYAPFTVSQGQFAPRVEWGNWSVAWAHGTAIFQSSGGNPMSTSFDEVTIARGFGAWGYDFGIPDVRIGISWPEIYLRGGFSGQIATPDTKTHVYTAGIGVSVVGLRMTVGDLIFGEARVGHVGVGAIGRDVTYRATDPNGSAQEDAVLQTGKTMDWLPTFRLGIAL